jgi:hypothetical protein
MQRGIVQAWRTKVVATYYQRYAAMVRALDPEHLILGIRYKGVPDLALFTALSPFFDVNSINDYNRYGHLKPVYTTLYKATGKPLMITEFSFSGFPIPGQPSALFVKVYSQANRGLGYAKYVGQAARAPLEQAWAWERDYFALQLSPVPTRKADRDALPVLFIYPREDGHDSRQPSAARWTRADGYRPLPLRVVQRRSPRGFTIEAHIPTIVLWGVRGKPGAAWRLTLRYQNVTEIYQTMWQGIVTL